MLLQCSSNKTCQNHARNCQGTKTIEMLGLEKIEILHPNMMKMEEKLETFFQYFCQIIDMYVIYFYSD